MNKFIRFSSILFFAFFPILFVYFRNQAFISDGGLATPLLVVGGAACLVYVLLNAFNHKPSNNVLIIIFISLWFSLYGHLYYFLLDYFNIHYSAFRHRFYFPIYTALFIILIWLLNKAQVISDKFILLVFFIGLTLNVQFLFPAVHSFNNNENNRPEKTVHPITAEQPDVYYIITDSYPSANILKKYYNFDNISFVNQLKALNFKVIDSAKSNYPFTYFSIPSSLNMEYINYFEDSVSIKKRNEDFPFTKIHHNKVADYFQAKGYQYVVFQSAYKELNNPDRADVYISYQSSMNHFYQSLIELSVLSIFNIQLYNKEVYNICSNEFVRLLEVADIKGSKFVFFHILPPHPPHVFDESGNYSNTVQTIENRYKQKKEYIAQVNYVNKALLNAIQIIFKKSDIPPIIIIQGDHGSSSSEKYEDEIKWQHPPSKALLEERFGILNAIYIPKNYSIHLPNNLTPVNTFRYVLNGIFKDTLTILPNRSYFAKYRKPYNFEEVNAGQ
jgi:hypothetical protein